MLLELVRHGDPACPLRQDRRQELIEAHTPSHRGAGKGCMEAARNAQRDSPFVLLALGLRHGVAAFETGLHPEPSRLIQVGDGILWGLTVRGAARKVGMPGEKAALISIQDELV